MIVDFAPSLLLKISPRILNKCTVWEALHNHRWLQDIASMARSIRMNRSYLKNGLTMRLDVPIGCPCKKYCCGGYNAMAPPASTRWSSICKGLCKTYIIF
uniref:Uncharacterized protein n=1 Tax=Triticum urartu TaxID=4572 RepID=A0A8R7V4H5_TRIUA